MVSKEEREIRAQLRNNKVKRDELKVQRETIKAEATRLRNERTALLEKAEKLGIKFTRKTAGA